MNQLFFGLKRSFQSALNLTRRAFAKLGVTAARYDMLNAIAEGPERGICQRALCDALGVTAPTVSRMVRSLEALAYVTREHGRTDRRRILVRLTALGRAILRRTSKRLGFNVDLAFDCALATCRPWNDGTVFEQWCALDSHLHVMRLAFRDRATMAYPWHPDD